MFEEKLLEPHFTSVLAPYMLDVVEQKRALGNKYNAGVEALSAFDDFCNEQQLRILAVLVGGRRAWLPEQVDRRLFRQRVFAFLPRQGRNFGRKYGGGIGKQNRRAHRRTQQRLHSLVLFMVASPFSF